MPSLANPNVLPCDSCGRPGGVNHFPGISPTSGVWCDKHLARLRWLHPLGERGRFVWMALLAIAFLGLTALEARAQECRGVPARYVHLMVDRRALSNGTAQYGGEAGLAVAGKIGAYGNYSAVDIGLAGSRTLSYGGTGWRQVRGGRFAACLTVGYQQGKSYLINAGGTNENLRITQNSYSIGGAASMAFRPAPGTRLMVFGFPSLIFGKKESIAYDRTTTTIVEDRPPPVGYVAGASFAISRLFARAYWVKAGDSDPLMVLAGGLAW